MSISLITNHDPLSRFKDGGRIKASGLPMPLLNTAIDVRILGGLAVVRTERVFHNAESNGIEATITFPVPVHATMAALAVSIDGRDLVGRAQSRQYARTTYETAIDEGKTVVLHEEAIRGIHILSVGNIPPGKEIRVVSTWAMLLSRQGGAVMVRIPVTVGDIYGRSPLADVDDLVRGPVRHMADLTVSSDSGTLSVRDVGLDHGRARIMLNWPIDVTVAGWRPRMLREWRPMAAG